MQTTIRAREPRELISLIPYQLGFLPQDSLVVVSLRGPRRQVGLVARVDLEALGCPERGAHTAAALVRHLLSDGASSVVLVVYRAAEQRPAPEPLVAGARRALLDAATGSVPVAATWCVSRAGYYELDCRADGCCPPGGRPLSELTSTAVSAEMVLSGATYVASRTELAAVPQVDAEERRAARKSAARWAARGERATTVDELVRWRSEGLALWRTEYARAVAELARAGAAEDGPAGARTQGWRAPRAVVLGKLQSALHDVLVRDAVLLGLVPGTDDVGDRVVAGGRGADVGRALGAIIDAEDGIQPLPELVAGARAVLEQVVAHAASSAQAPALTLLAVLSWWEGDGARAAVLCDRALDVDPTHRLALLVGDALDQGLPPGWARRGAAGAPGPARPDGRGPIG